MVIRSYDRSATGIAKGDLARHGSHVGISDLTVVGGFSVY
jgi:hypothetical protein